MEIFKKFRCKTAEIAGKSAKFMVKQGKGMGKSFPGYIFLRLGSLSCVELLAQKPEIGSILITGTNGKTTTTRLTSLLLGKDTDIAYNYDSNTLNAVVTGLLTDNVQLGVFEYGIRDIEHAIPDQVCNLINPAGVVYTTISREHSLVAGKKNPFQKYLKAKKLLSQPMKRGIVISNADDPNTAYIGKEKEKDIRVNYYGLDIGLEDDLPLTWEVKCPYCAEILNYSHRYLNHRGIYQCSCGFSRPEPQIKFSNFKNLKNSWEVELEAQPFNYSVNDILDLNFSLNLPDFGVHNLYNFLCALSTYLSFTPYPEKIVETVKAASKIFDVSILPPGRFEIFQMDHKIVGIGQGDNGDALKANIQYIDSYSSEELAIIYTTPDQDEDDIFEDHLISLIAQKPVKIYVFPGRESVKAAKAYYEILREKLDAEFYPISNENLSEKMDQIIQIIINSPHHKIMVSGCGPEHELWARLKSRSKTL